MTMKKEIQCIMNRGISEEMMSTQENAEFYGKYEFRTIHADEAETAENIELACFPPNEACKLPIMKQRVELAPDIFLVVVEKENGKMVGYITGLATNEVHLRDEFFTEPILHDPDGNNVMILSVAVLPEYRNQGLAREMMRIYLNRETDRNRQSIVLACLEGKVKMYEKFGFRDCGESGSAWGGERWHEMVCELT